MAFSFADERTRAACIAVVPTAEPKTGSLTSDRNRHQKHAANGVRIMHVFLDLELTNSTDQSFSGDVMQAIDQSALAPVFVHCRTAQNKRAVTHTVAVVARNKSAGEVVSR
jgi:hypothetical protein